MVTEPLEGAVATVSGLKSLTSVSGEGSSVLICEFNWGSNLDAARDDIKERLGFVPLPDAADQPLVLRYDPTSMAGMHISVSGELSEERREEVVQDILRDIESVPGVASVDISGVQEREIKVLLNRENLAATGVSQFQVVQAIQAGNIVSPAGTVIDSELEAHVRVLGALTDVNDLRSIIVGAGAKGFLTLGQVAEVIDGRTDRVNIVRTNGDTAAILSVRKEGDANLVQVNRAVLDRLDQLDARMDDVSLVVTMNQAEFIEDTIASIGQNLVVGAGLAVLVLLVFLRSPLSTLIIAVSIPFSVLATFALMQFTGLTLNIMSLGGLALGVGMMVDNSIVVIENIYRLVQQGVAVPVAAARGTNEVAGAITASTLTTLAVFLPVVYVGGITGELFQELAWTVSFSLLASLMVAVTVIPMLASKILPLGRMRDAIKPRGSRGWYPRAVHWALNRRWLVLGAVTVLIAGSLLPFSRLGREFLPAMDEGAFSMGIVMPVGTPMETTGAVTEEIEQLLAGHADISLCSTRIGGAGSGRNMDRGGKNIASIDVCLVPPDSRNSSTEEVMAWARQEAEKLVPAGASVSVQRQDLISSMAGSDSLTINVRGLELHKVQELAGDLQAKLAELPGLADVTTNLDERLPEQQVQIRRLQAAVMGLTPGEIAAQVSAAKNGQIATFLNVEGVNVPVKVSCAGLDTREDLETLILTARTGQLVPLSAVAEIQPGQGPMTLHRIEQQTTAQITAAIVEGDLGSISKQVNGVISGMNWPQGYQAAIGGAGQLMQEGFESLYMALALAVILVYIVMAALFESLLHPLVIILTLPLAAMGAIGALYVSGSALGITALIGIIMLAGIVVNNAIVMVDAINLLRRKGLGLKDAIVTGAGTRIRPILMTASTTIIAMLPLAMGVGEGAELQAPLAAAVLGGLLSSTLLTLFVVPVVYSLLAGKCK